MFFDYQAHDDGQCQCTKGWRQLREGLRRGGLGVEGLGVEAKDLAVEGLNIKGFCVEKFCMGGLGVGGLAVGGLGVGEAWINDRHRGLSLAMVLHALNSVGRPLRRNAYLSVRPLIIICGHPIGRGCATHPVSSCRGVRLMGIRAT